MPPNWVIWKLDYFEMGHLDVIWKWGYLAQRGETSNNRKQQNIYLVALEHMSYHLCRWCDKQSG